jgi:hypothetical protein
MVNENSTGGTTSSKREAARAMPGVGGVRGSDDPALDPATAGFGQPAGESRSRGTTCSAGVKRNEGRGDGPRGLQAPNKVPELQITLGRRASAFRPRELGKPDAGKPLVRFDEGREAGGHWPSGLSNRRFPPTLHPAPPHADP